MIVVDFLRNFSGDSEAEKKEKKKRKAAKSDSKSSIKFPFS